MSMNVWVKNGRVYNLAPEAGTTGTGVQTEIFKDAPKATIQVVSTAAATVQIQVSNDKSNWILAGTVTLAGAGTDGFTTDASWKYIRANVTANSGTVTAYLGV